MVQRFNRNRSRFLFPLDLRPAQGEVAARPVNAFTRASQGPIIQAPGRPFDIPRPSQSNSLIELARSLGVTGQNLTEISDRQGDVFNQQAELEGARLSAEDELSGNKQNWRQFISRTRVSQGEDEARELMGMNPHVQRGFDATRARSAALNFNAAIQNEFASNPALTEDGSVRLHDIDVSDPLYLQWLETFTSKFNDDNGITGIDPRALATVIPAQQDARTRVGMAQSELRGELKLRQFEDATAEFVSTIILDLSSNSEWLRGENSGALVETADIITQQIDSANTLGFGGADLEGIMDMTVDHLIAAAVTAGNADLLQVAEMVKVGPPEKRKSILDTRNGATYRSAIATARRAIIDREFQLNQRERQVRDQNREDSQNQGLELIAQAAGIYENVGRTTEARESLDNILAEVREDAAENGWSAQFNNLVGKVLQEGVDNQGVNIIDYAAIADFEADLLSGQLSGRAAHARANDMLLNGFFGNSQQSYETYRRLTATIADGDNRNQQALTTELRRASDDLSRAIVARLGFTEDDRGRRLNIRQTLNAANFTDDQIRRVTTMTAEELEAQIAANDYGVQVEQALGLIVNQGIDPFDLPDAIDPAVVMREETLFKNEVFDGIRAFEEREGRTMNTVERQAFINESLNSYLSNQAAQLLPSNPLSSLREPETEVGRYREGIFDEVFSSLDGSGGNPESQIVMDELQIIKALEYFSATNTWHPRVNAVARINGMSPMALIQRQSSLHGTQIDNDLLTSIGISPIPRADDYQPQSSVYSNDRDITRDYSPGRYTVYTGDFIDTSPLGSWDFTLIQNDGDEVNVPAPFDGVVTGVFTEATSGGYGNGIVIQERGSSNHIFLAHAAEVYLQPGDRFQQGQAIFKQGSTGRSTNEHIHMEVRDSKGNRISDRAFTRPIVNQWLDYIESSQFTTSSTSGQWGGSLPTQQPELADSIASSASRLGVPADQLASVLALESSLDVNSRGGDEDLFVGLWQASPDVQAAYGVYQGMPAPQQMAALERYLADRGYTPDMGIERLYSTILAGNPFDVNSRDSNGTSAQGVSEQFRPGGTYHNEARTILGF